MEKKEGLNMITLALSGELRSLSVQELADTIKALGNKTNNVNVYDGDKLVAEYDASDNMAYCYTTVGDVLKGMIKELGI